MFKTLMLLAIFPGVLWAAVPQQTLILNGDNIRIHGVRYLNENGRPNNGPWVLLTHGLHSNLHEFEHVSKILMAAGYDCYAFNFRGHGNGNERSEVLRYREGDYRLEHMAETDLPLMLEKILSLNRGKGHLIGHSMGGMVPRAAIALSKLNQSILKSFVLMGSPPHFRRSNTIRESGLLKPLENEIYRGAGNELIGMAHLVDQIEKGLDTINILNPFYWLLKSHLQINRSLVRDLGVYLGLLPGDQWDQRSLTRGIPKDILRSFSEFPKNYPYEDIRLDVPALYVMGDADKLVAGEDIEATAKLQSKDAGYWFIKLKGVGHLSLVAPKVVEAHGELLTKFLRRPESIGPKNETEIEFAPVTGCESVLVRN